MADSAAPAPAKKVVKAKKAGATKKPVAHPNYPEMISAAITALKERKGSSGMAIKKYIIANFKVSEKSVGPYVRRALIKEVASGSLKQVKGTGAAGSFKLPEKVVKPKKAKKPAAKKAAKSPKKAAKKPAAKKAAAKKSPKKAAKKAAKSPAKKPVAKKAKKPAAKKAPAKK